MSIAKTAESIKLIQHPELVSEKKSSIQLNEKEMTFASVPIDLFRQLGLELDGTSDRDLARLKDIHGWLGEGSIGEKCQQLSKIERELGTRHFSENRLARLWNYFKLSNKIADMQKQKDALKSGVYV